MSMFEKNGFLRCTCSLFEEKLQSYYWKSFTWPIKYCTWTPLPMLWWFQRPANRYSDRWKSPSNVGITWEANWMPKKGSNIHFWSARSALTAPMAVGTVYIRYTVNIFCILYIDNSVNKQFILYTYIIYIQYIYNTVGALITCHTQLIV
jgi:hypothetical protein